MGEAVRLAALKQLLTRPVAARAAERCELCGAELTGDHRHLIDARARRLVCACEACLLAPGSRGGDTPGQWLRPSPPRAAQRPVRITATEWASLDIPVDLVFLFFNTALARPVACYPGPAGATESILPLDGWQALVNAHPDLRTLAADVEAVLVRRAGDEYQGFVVPIDRCYALVGRIRAAWSGVGGGDGVRRELAAFFESLGDPSGVPS